MFTTESNLLELDEIIGWVDCLITEVRDGYFDLDSEIGRVVNDLRSHGENKTAQRLESYRDAWLAGHFTRRQLQDSLQHLAMDLAF